MNGRVRHKKRRRRVYGRNNIGIIVLISVVALVFILGTLLIVGNHLHDKSEENSENNSNETDIWQSEADETNKRTSATVKGRPVLLETRDSSTLPERLDALVSQGVYTASIPLNTKDGKLLYNSATAKKIGVAMGTEKILLDEACAYAKERNIYTCGVYYTNAFAESDPILRSVELSKVTAIIAEALVAGMDEIVIIAPQMTAEHVSEAIRLAENIKALTENGAVGLAVPDSIMSLEDDIMRSELIAKLYEKIDFLATDVSDTENSAVTVSERLSRDKLYLHMYKMRVLLPYSTDENTQDAFITAAEENGIENWQIIKY